MFVPLGAGGIITAGWAVMRLCDRRWTGRTAGTDGETAMDKRDSRNRGGYRRWTGGTAGTQEDTGDGQEGQQDRGGFRQWTGGTAGTEGDTDNDRKNERKYRRVGDRAALHAAGEKEAKQGNEDVNRRRV